MGGPGGWRRTKHRGRAPCDRFAGAVRHHRKRGAAAAAADGPRKSWSSEDLAVDAAGRAIARGADSSTRGVTRRTECRAAERSAGSGGCRPVARRGRASRMAAASPEIRSHTGSERRARLAEPADRRQRSAAARRSARARRSRRDRRALVDPRRREPALPLLRMRPPAIGRSLVVAADVLRATPYSWRNAAVRSNAAARRAGR